MLDQPDRAVLSVAHLALTEKELPRLKAAGDEIVNAIPRRRQAGRAQSLATAASACLGFTPLRARVLVEKYLSGDMRRRPVVKSLEALV